MGLVKRQIFSLFTVLLLVGLWSWNTLSSEGLSSSPGTFSSKWAFSWGFL